MRGMNIQRILLAAIVLSLSAPLFAADSKTEVKRPPIVGVAWISLRTADMDGTRKFYTGYLGLPELSKDAVPGAAVFQVDEHQFVQVLPELKDPKQNRLIDMAFETSNAEQLRAYLASKGVKVPEKVEATGLGTMGFAITDTENHVVKFVQFASKSPAMKTAGQDNRVSSHMIHTGFIVHDRAGADHLFRDILEFKETWHGGMKDNEVSWVDMRVPEGKDWLEYMLNYPDDDVRISGIMNHLALGVPSVKDGYETVVKRGMDPEKPKIGRDGKWQLNLYSPDLTRVELMEPKPVETPCCSPMLQ